MATPLCELCNKNERYHICTESNNQHLCLTCFNKLHFGINAPRTGKSMVYNKCIFCKIVFATNAKGSVCDECSIIVTWKSAMNYLAGVNRITALIRENKLDSKLRNENYCNENLGTRATQVIMDAIDSSSLLSKR
jgi:hypothetical protein